MLLSVFNDWYLEIVKFINYEMSDLAFMAVLGLIIISVLAMVRYVVKYGYNVSTQKKNLVFPIVLIVLLSALAVFISSVRYV